MQDKVFEAFLNNAEKEALALVAESDCLAVVPVVPRPFRRYLCTFQGIQHLQQLGSGIVEVSSLPIIAGIYFPPGYLKGTDSHLYLKVVSLLSPVFHPNILGPAICLGNDYRPGTRMSALLWHIYSVVSYRNMTVDEKNALNAEACRFCREHPEMIAKLQARPLRRRVLHGRGKAP